MIRNLIYLYYLRLVRITTELLHIKVHYAYLLESSDQLKIHTTVLSPFDFRGRR